MLFNNLSPETERILYKERERDLDHAIQMRLAREGQAGADLERGLPWYVQAFDWLADRLPFQAAEPMPAPDYWPEPLPVTGKVQRQTSHTTAPRGC